MVVAQTLPADHLHDPGFVLQRDEDRGLINFVAVDGVCRTLGQVRTAGAGAIWITPNIGIERARPCRLSASVCATFPSRLADGS